MPALQGQLFPDGSGLKLERRANIVWEGGGPKSALLVKKPNSAAAAEKLGEIADWCAQPPFFGLSQFPVLKCMQGDSPSGRQAH